MSRASVGRYRQGYRHLPLIFCFWFLLLSIVWASGVPVPSGENYGRWANFQPDEANHIAVIKYMAIYRSLPPYNYTYYESAHPPFYHAAAAIFYSLLLPIRGEAITLLLLRIGSCLLGTMTIWLIWRGSRALFGGRAALIAVGIAANIPTFTSLSGGIGNEIWAAWASAAALVALIELVRRGLSGQRLLWLTFFTVLAVGAKITCLGLLPAAISGIVIVGHRHRIKRQQIAGYISALSLICFAATGWWFIRNKILYGDFLRQKASDELWRDRIPGYAELAPLHPTTNPFNYLANAAFDGWLSFWGAFDATSRILPPTIFVFIAAITVYSFAQLLLKRQHLLRQASPLILFAVFAAWVALVFFVYNWHHFSPQGRFFFPLLLPFAALLGKGIDLSHARYRRPLSVTILVALTAINLFALLRYNPLRWQ